MSESESERERERERFGTSWLIPGASPRSLYVRAATFKMHNNNHIHTPHTHLDWPHITNLNINAHFSKSSKMVGSGQRNAKRSFERKVPQDRGMCEKVICFSATQLVYDLSLKFLASNDNGGCFASPCSYKSVVS